MVAKPELKVIILVEFFLLITGFILLKGLAVADSYINSLVIGALIFIIPNAYFTYYAFRYSGARAAPLVMNAFYRGETGKYVLTAVFFALAFALVKPLDILMLFITYIFFTVLAWMLALWMTK